MKSKIPMRLTIVALIVAVTPLLAQTSAAPKANPAAKTAVEDPAVLQASIGQRKFEANCSRCHSAPEQLSPSITGTVVRHMRVRATLSAQDEKDILKFLAP
jgi:cytochrome c5